jgi:hypothetical protein
MACIKKHITDLYSILVEQAEKGQTSVELTTDHIRSIFGIEDCYKMFDYLQPYLKEQDIVVLKLFNTEGVLKSFNFQWS